MNKVIVSIVIVLGLLLMAWIAWWAIDTIEDNETQAKALTQQLFEPTTG